MTTYHDPVLLHKSIESLITSPNGVYIDCTFGGGGHSAEILKHLDESGKLIAFDQDLDAINNRLDDPRFQLITQNFRFIKNNLRFLGIDKVDGILSDLGVSSYQFDTSDRGFSTRFEGSLDMRMNQKSGKTAGDIINQYSEEDLVQVFKEYGELRQAKKWANIIVSERKTEPITQTTQLQKILEKYIPHHKRNKIFAQLFQALRIEVNDELSALKELLLQSVDLIKPEGRLVMISYHSLEDRLVKRFIKFGMFEGEPERDMYGRWYAPFQPLQAKVIIPNETEIEKNSRARSAKLRIGIKNHEQD